MLLHLLLRAALAAPLQTDQALSPSGPDLDPDGPWSGYGVVGGRFFGHVGTHASIAGRPEGPLGFSIGLQGFVELLNFTDDYPISFQSFRAHVGLESLWALPGLPLSLRLGWFHESDHVADKDSFLTFRDVDYIDGNVIFADYDDNNVSSYEFLRLEARWQIEQGTRWSGHLSAVPRVFTPDVNPYARRELTAGLGGEARAAVRLTDNGSLAAGARLERWWHNFDPVAVGLRDGLGEAPLTWRTAELAWQQQPAAGRWWVYALTHSNSSGRGSDFFVEHGPEWGASVRFVR